MSVHKYIVCAHCNTDIGAPGDAADTAARLAEHTTRKHPDVAPESFGPPRWRVFLELPPHADGTRRRRQKRGFKTKSAARDWEDEQRGDIAQGVIPVAPSKAQTVAVWLRAWLAGLNLAGRTVAGYRDMCEWYIIPHIGGIKLTELTAEQVDALYRLLERGGWTRTTPKGKVREHGPLAPKTVRNVHVALHRALNVAVERGHVRRNVASLANPPSAKAARSRNVERVWIVDQLRRWLDHIADDRLYGVWYLLMTTGLRRGEVCGLHWDLVDLDAGRLKVRWQLTVEDNQPVWVDHAKSERGMRTVDLDDGTVAALRGHRRRQAAERLACGPGYMVDCPCPVPHPNDLVVCWPDGTMMHPDRLLRAIYRHARALGLPRIDVHGLRHSYATAFLEAGGRVEVLSERLGHDDPATTLRTYAHVRREDHQQAAAETAKWITG